MISQTPLQASGQAKTQENSANKMVNADRAAKTAG
jgi:hypothetical protein